MTPTVTTEPTLILSVRRALRLLEAVGDHPRGAQAKVLARQLDLPLATTYHLLRTLVHDGYLRKLPDGAFVLGDGVNALARGDGQQLPLRQVRPAMAALRDHISAATYLSLFVDGEIEVLQIVDSPRAPRADVPVGTAIGAHASALGKCILGQLPELELQDYLARHELADFTPRTLTTRTSLRRQLSCETGNMIVDREEYALGTACAAVPLTDGTHVGSLAISVPAERVQHLPDITRTLQSAAGRISKSLSLSI